MAADLSVTLLEEGAPRSDFAARREIKYVFTRRDVATLRQVLLRSCRPIQYAGPVSTVRSIYFDEPGLGTCRANLDGVGIRHKTRLRWYDSRQPGNPFFLETKWRRHRVCGKYRFRLSSSISPAEAPFRVLHRELLRGLAGRQGVHLWQETEPVILVEYRREHFVLDEGSTRLTLDYDLKFFPQIGRRRLSRCFPEALPDVVIIESKSEANDSLSLCRALAPLRTRPSRFSKYVIGCQRLGYVSTA